MKDLLKHLIEKLVDHPEDIQINEVAGENTHIFELRVHQDDLGKIIGKQGRTAKAIRTILSASSVKENKRCILEILD